MNMAVGLACLVVVCFLGVATSFPDQELDLENKGQVTNEDHLQRQDSISGTKCACKIAGGSCQLLTEECDGVMRTAEIYCKNPKKGCCVPTGLGENNTIQTCEAPKCWTAKQLVMKSSAGSLCRGIFVCRDDTKMMKRRRIAIEVNEKIEFSGSDLSNRFYSKEFTDKTSSQDFVRTVNNFGSDIAVSADAQYLFVEAKASYSTSKSDNFTSIHKTAVDKEYLASISCYTVPTKSVDLDPFYMVIKQRVLCELKQIETNINESNGHYITLFREFFETYGSHFQTGPMEFGGTVIVKSETTVTDSSQYDELKHVISTSSDTQLSLSITDGEESAGGGFSSSAYDIKENFSNISNTEMLKQITITLEKQGGPADKDDIKEWRTELVTDIDTWRIIDKSTQLIAIWDLIRLNHPNEFKDCKNFTGSMQDAWDHIVDVDHEKELETLPSLYYTFLFPNAMLELLSEFEELGISLNTLTRRKEIIIEMLSKNRVGIEKNGKYAYMEYTDDGSLVMNHLQKTPLENGTTLMQFESIRFMQDHPYKVYLKLMHNEFFLGIIVIILDGYSKYPRYVQQFLDLSTGDNDNNGSWTGAGFDYRIENPGLPGELLKCSGYMNASGLQHASLYSLPDEEYPSAPVMAGQVIGWSGNVSRFDIIIQDGIRGTHGYTRQGPIIGRVTSGIDLLQTVAARGDSYTEDIKFTNCGLVVIETDQSKTSEMVKLVSDFRDSNISTASAPKRQQLLVEMLSRGPLVGEKNGKLAIVSSLEGGQVFMSTLQEGQSSPDTTVLPFDILSFLPEIPHKVFLRLEYNQLYLGDIIIVLNGPNPRRMQQFLELSTGDNNVGGAWRGAGFKDGVVGLENAIFGVQIKCGGYMNASGLQTGSLFPVDDPNTLTSIVAGEVRGYNHQDNLSGFLILTQDGDKDAESSAPVIGHVTPESLSLLRVVVARGDDFAKAITFTNCGLVVID